MSEINVNKIMDRSGANALLKNLFVKDASDIVAWTKTGNGTAETQTGLTLEVGDKILYLASGTSISMPTTLNAGTDYAIWVAPDGTLEADASFTVAPTTGGRRIGGFHYAPGGNATGQSGGDSTSQINEYSFHDLKWRPSCEDPRGMTLVADGFWADIYLLNRETDINGTSAFNTTIALGGSGTATPKRPKIPSAFNGDGTTFYSRFSFFEAQEVLAAYGKKSPNYSEFMALAFGVTEETSNTEQTLTVLDAPRTSRWGVIQATGNWYVWGRDHISNVSSANEWFDVTGGRGEIRATAGVNAVSFGGDRNGGTKSGSRASFWQDRIERDGNNFTARGVCDHLILD